MKTVTGRQIAAARVLVGMRQKDIAIMSNISIDTLRRIESCDDEPSSLTNNTRAVVTTLESLGAVFIPASAAGRGVRLRHSDIAAE